MAWRRRGFWWRVVPVLLKPLLWTFTKRTWRGMEHIPESGGAIFAANHTTEADPVVLGHYVHDAGRRPEYLAKASLFHKPVLGYALRQLHQIPVYRNTADASKSLEAAVAAINRGDSVIIYPEGTTTKHPDLWPMRGKTGVARLALATGAPVIPVVHWGSERIFDPRRRKLRLRPRTPVTVVAGEPIDLSPWRDAPINGRTLTEVTDVIMNRIREMVAEIRGEPAPDLYEPTREAS